MNYKLEGKGNTLVFIHGLSDNLLYWEFLASNLKNDFQVLRVDLRGHGESELGNDEITIDTYVNDLNNLLEDLNLSSVNLIGFSLGGLVALDFAVKYPQKLDSLVLMSSYYKTDEKLKSTLNQFKNTLSISFEEFYDFILPLVLCPQVIEKHMDELELLKDINSFNANTDAYIKACDVCLNFNAEKDLSKIIIPTLILAGRYDEISTLEMQMDLHSKIKDCELIVFDDAKHNLLVGDNAKKTLNILKEFFKKQIS